MRIRIKHGLTSKVLVFDPLQETLQSLATKVTQKLCASGLYKLMLRAQDHSLCQLDSVHEIMQDDLIELQPQLFCSETIAVPATPPSDYFLCKEDLTYCV
jgi:hypothetical protein